MTSFKNRRNFIKFRALAFEIQGQQYLCNIQTDKETHMHRYKNIEINNIQKKLEIEKDYFLNVLP